MAGVKEFKVIIVKAGSQKSHISLHAVGKCLHLLHKAKAQVLLPWQSHALDGHLQPRSSFHSLHKLSMVLSQSTRAPGEAQERTLPFDIIGKEDKGRRARGQLAG